MESSKKLKSEMKEFIYQVCEKVGPRPPCSNSELEGAKIFHDKLKNFCNDISIENFTVPSNTYKAGFRIPMILYVVSILFNWYYPWLSLILIVLSFTIILGKMILARGIIDILFPKRKSQNVISKIRPKGQVKSLLIIGCHIDSNWEYPLIRKLRYRFTVIIGINVFLNVILLTELLMKKVLILTKIYPTFHEINVLFFWIFVGGTPIILHYIKSSCYGC